MGSLGELITRIFHRRPNILAFVFVAGLSFIAYANALPNSFHFDDFVGIVDNPAVWDLKQIPSYFTDTSTLSLIHREWRPIVQITYALNYFMAGRNPTVFRAFNLLFHIGTAFFIYLIVAEMVKGRDLPADAGRSANWPAMISAALFTVHTANSEVVDYIWARSSLLATFFYLLSFYCFLRGPFSKKEGALLWHLGGLVCFVLGMGAKPTAATLPAVLVLYEILFLNPTGQNPLRLFLREPWRLKKYLPLLMLFLIATFAVLTLLPWIFRRIVDPGWVTPLAYLFTQFRAWVYYLRLFLWPVSLIFDFYSFGWSHSFWDPRVLLSLAVILTIIVLGWYLRKRDPLVTFFTLWFFIALIPEASFIPLPRAVEGYRPYLAYVGLSVVAALLSLKGAIWIRGKVKIEGEASLARFWLYYGLALGIILTVLTVATIMRNQDWRDGMTLWSDVLRKDPYNPGAYSSLGLELFEKGDYQRAQEAFDKAVELAPRRSAGYRLRGFFNLEIGRNSEALADLNKAIELGGPLSYNFYLRGQLYRKMEEYDKALADYQRVIRSRPRFTDAHYGIAMVHWKRGEFKDAGEACRIIIETDPYDPRGYDCLGAVLMEEDRFLEALNMYQKGVAHVPQNSKLWFSLGVVYEAVGLYREAEETFGKASSLMRENERGLSKEAP